MDELAQPRRRVACKVARLRHYACVPLKRQGNLSILHPAQPRAFDAVEEARLVVLDARSAARGTDRPEQLEAPHSTVVPLAPPAERLGWRLEAARCATDHIDHFGQHCGVNALGLARAARFRRSCCCRSRGRRGCLGLLCAGALARAPLRVCAREVAVTFFRLRLLLRVGVLRRGRGGRRGDLLLHQHRRRGARLCEDVDLRKADDAHLRAASVDRGCRRAGALWATEAPRAVALYDNKDRVALHNVMSER